MSAQQQNMSSLPMVPKRTDHKMEESSVRLDKVQQQQQQHQQRLLSADPSHQTNQQRRATRAATALAKPPGHPLQAAPTRIESFLGFVEKYRKLFEVIQINETTQTNLQIIQCFISIALVALLPYHSRWYISFVCGLQFLCSLLFLIYRLVIVPKHPPNEKRLAFLYLIYLLTSGLWTLIISIIFFILQTEATFLQIRCCERSTYNALDSCMDNKLQKNDMIPQLIAENCSDPWGWRAEFHKLNAISFTLIPFTVVQAISHHFCTSLLIYYMRQGHIFSPDAPKEKLNPSAALSSAHVQQ
ncbi:hypothetical protein BC829DRAFT_394798 [Chytridium lagenaria]|nr:hypothetical protein BC829DRAFT_394798 [Chytridium lagenaria]